MFFASALLLAAVRPRRAVQLGIGLSIIYPQYLHLAEPYGSLLGQIDFAATMLGLSAGLLPWAINRMTHTEGVLAATLGALFAVFVLVGIVRGSSAADVYTEAGPLLGYVFVLAVPRYIGSDRRRLWQLLRIVYFSLFVGAGFSILEYLEGVGISNRDGYVQVLSSKAQIAAFVGGILCWKALTSADLRQQLRITARASYVGLLFYGVVLALTLNRSVILALAALAIATLAGSLNRRRLRLRSAGASLFLLVPAVAIPFVWSDAPGASWHVVAREATVDIHRAYEPTVFRDSLNISTAVVGSGAGSRWRRPWDGVEEFGMHNLLVHVPYKHGLVGIFAIGLVVAVVVRIRRAVGAVADASPAPSLSPVASLATTALGGLLAMSITQNRFYSVGHIALIGALMGMLLASHRLSVTPRRSPEFRDTARSRVRQRR